ncbi:LexA/Signal peptidase [Fomitopsis betulina]|nr:LexA/Signal peptidase [Fomitopsis betulina]
MRKQWSSIRQSWRTFWGAHRRLRRALYPLVWLPTGIVFTELFYTMKYINGRSMQPTLNPDTSARRDVVIFDRLSIRTLRRYERGDVVALASPLDSKFLVKRIVALEGDTVKTLPPYPDTEVLVPPGCAWVEGDEYFHSEDSNTFGPVPLALIDSKLAWIIWPPHRYGRLPPPSEPDPKAPRGPGWRVEKAIADKARWRNSRVTVAQQKPSSDGLTTKAV